MSEIGQVWNNTCPKLRKLRKMRCFTLTSHLWWETPEWMKWRCLGNERFVKFFSQVISRDGSPGSMTKEEGRLGGCHCLDVVRYTLTWLLVSSSECIPLKFDQPCWSSVLVRWFSSVYHSLLICALVLIFLTHSLAVISSNESAKNCTGGRR